ncbi:MAG: tetratricopeptide repeat protein [Saprospirales bacterium]|nr:tetratricopeptide repeat protein [Saprospirales bacterium]
MAKADKKKKIAPEQKSNPIFAWAGLAVIILVTFAIYAPSLQNEFINLDDPGYVTGNPYIQELTAKNIGKLFTEPLAGYYHPVTMLSLALDYRVSGPEPYTFHLVNLLLHVANTILVFFFIYLLSHRKVVAALFTALFFAIHPMHVESVVWVAQRKDLLYTFFFLPAMISYLYFVRGKSSRYYWIALGLFVLSLASKPAAGILPFILLLTDYLEGRKKEWKLLVEKIPFFALSILTAVLTWSAQSQLISYNKPHSFFEKMLYSSYGMLEYAVKCIVPFRLSAFHPYPLPGQSLGWMFIAAPFVLLTLAVLVYLFLKKNKPTIFGLLFFVFSILLVLQLFADVPALTAERFTYLAYIGLLFPLGMLVAQALKREPGKNPVYGIVAGVIVLIGAGIFANQAAERVKIWKNSASLWTNVIQQYPNNAPDAYNNRGLVFFSQERIEEALADYNQAISMDSTYHLPILNRGTLYLSTGNYEEALEDLNKGLALAPDYEKGYINRAGVFLKTQRFEDAVRDYDKVLELNPEIAQIYYLRGYAKMSLGRNPEALEDLNKAIELNDRVGNYYLYRSYAYNFMGNRQQAREDAIMAQQLGAADMDQEYLNSLQGQ